MVLCNVRMLTSLGAGRTVELAIQAGQRGTNPVAIQPLYVGEENRLPASFVGVHEVVMLGAEHDQVVFVVGAALGAVGDVMLMEVLAGATHPTPTAVADLNRFPHTFGDP